MANGPPTPPPTTEAELQDEARGASSGGHVHETITPQTGEDAYQSIFSTIADLASQSNFQGLVRTAEHSDLSVRSENLISTSLWDMKLLWNRRAMQTVIVELLDYS